MTVGKSPHRKEGKADADEWARPLSERLDAERRARPPATGQANPSRVEAEEAIGGSRPRVPSRVKDAIEAREDREER